jgi:hypothetical protein
MNLEPKLTVPRKISIKALDIEKLPKKFINSNNKMSTFLNITRSSSNQIIEGIPSSLNKQNKKSYYVKPMTSRRREPDAIKLNEMPKTSYINITPDQKLKQLSRNKNLNNFITQSIYKSYNNNIHKTADQCLPFNSPDIYNNNYNNNLNSQFGQFLNKMKLNKGNSRNVNSSSNILVSSSTYSFKIKNKDSINAAPTSNAANKFSNNKSNINNSNHFSQDRIDANKNYVPKKLLIN